MCHLVIIDLDFVRYKAFFGRQGEQLLSNEYVTTYFVDV